MAETLISPGVLARENDSSQITSQPVEFGAALITPAVLGPVEVPTLVTSFSEYEAIFGSTLNSGSGQYSYLGSVAANNYFSQGGTSLLVSRVVTTNNGTASFAPASSTRIQNNTPSGELVTRNFVSSSGANNFLFRGSNPNITTNPSASGFAYNIAFGAPGATGSTPGSSYKLSGLAGSLSGTGAEVKITLASGVSGTASFASFEVVKSGSGFVANETITINSASLGATTAPSLGSNFVITLAAANIQGTNALTLSSLSEGEVSNSELSETSGGALVSGSANNVRWEVTAANTSSGVFSLAVRRGNDRNQQKALLETFTNVSLDPSQANYVEEQIGNTSFSIQQDGTDRKSVV